MFRLLFLMMLFMLHSPAESAGKWRENYKYPFPVSYFKIKAGGQDQNIAYMQVRPETWNGQTVLLMHGKNFVSAYWEGTIKKLTHEGFQVLAVDQLGFGKSSRPLNLTYSFHLLALQTKSLLDSLNIAKVSVLGHSMGGMLAVRFSLMFPDRTRRLILENPVGLEDYRTKVPYVDVDTKFAQQLRIRPEQIYAHHKRYFVHHNKNFLQWPDLQAASLSASDKNTLAKVSALHYDMLYTQPVVHEFKSLKVPVLLIIGDADRTAPGKNAASLEDQQSLGDYPYLSKKARDSIPGAKLVLLKDVGHIPHLESFERFFRPLVAFLKDRKFANNISFP